MRVTLDVCVAIAALETAMRAGLEGIPIHRDAVAGCVLHVLVAMTGEAVRLRVESAGYECGEKESQCRGEYPAPGAPPCLECCGGRSFFASRRPFNWEHIGHYGFNHPAGFFLRAIRGGAP